MCSLLVFACVTAAPKPEPMGPLENLLEGPTEFIKSMISLGENMPQVQFNPMVKVMSEMVKGLLDTGVDMAKGFDSTG